MLTISTLLTLAMATTLPAEARSTPETPLLNAAVAPSPDQTITAVESWVESTGSLDYFVDPADGHYVVRVARDQVALVQAHASPPNAPVEIRPSVSTAAQIAQQRQVVESREWDPHAKSYLYLIYFDAASDSLIVYTTAPATIADQLPHTPGVRMRVEHVDADQRPAPASFEPQGVGSRQTAEGARRGGAGIHHVDFAHENNLCTAGFTVQNKTTKKKVMLTAGHCFGDTINVLPIFGEKILGNFARNDRWYPRTDAGVVVPLGCCKTDFIGQIWVGGSGQSKVDAKNVKGARDPHKKEADLCVSGYATGLHCGGVVETNNATVCDDGFENCHHDSALVFWKYGSPSLPGDSGAPWFRYTSGGVLALGTHSGSVGGRGSQPRLSYFQKWKSIESALNVKIVTR